MKKYYIKILNMNKINAMKRIKEDYISFTKNSLISIGYHVSLPNEDNIFQWKLMLLGPKDTSYKAGLFYIN